MIHDMELDISNHITNDVSDVFGLVQKGRVYRPRHDDKPPRNDGVAPHPKSLTPQGDLTWQCKRPRKISNVRMNIV